MVVVAVASNATKCRIKPLHFPLLINNVNQWLSLLLMSGFVLALGMKKRLNKIKALFKEGALSLKISIIFSLIVILRGMFCLP